MDKQFIFPHDRLAQYTEKVFLSIGMDRWSAQLIASHLVATSLRGVDSHGISRVPLYAERLIEGYVKKGREVKRFVDEPAYALIDGQNRHGIVVAQQAVELAVEKARSQGLAVVGVKRSNHFGMLAYYAQYAVNRDCMVMITSNASPSMPPWGGSERFFGTNPICYGIPAGKEPPVIGDMATSVVARGKIRLAAKNGQSIPEGWAITEEGERTTDAEKALDGMVLPMAGPKGYSLIVWIETLSSIMTGAAFGPHVGAIVDPKEQGLGHFFFVMRPDLFQSMDTFKERMDQMIREIRQVKKMKHVDHIYLPGEIERNTETERLKNGIPISFEVYRDLLEIGDRVGIDTSMIRLSG